MTTTRAAGSDTDAGRTMPQSNERPSAKVALRRLRERAGLSMRELARSLGFGISKYQHYEDRYQRPYLPGDLVEALLPVFEAKGIDPKEVMALSGPRTDFPLRQLPRASKPSARKTAARQGGVKYDLPIVAVSIKGRSPGDRTFTIEGKMARVTSRPAILEGVHNAYAVAVLDDDMAPRYFKGEQIKLHPGLPPRPGHHVLVNLVRKTKHRRAKAILGRLDREDSRVVVLTRYAHPKRPLTIKRAEVASIHVIVNGGMRDDRPAPRDGDGMRDDRPAPRDGDGHADQDLNL